MKKKKIVLWMRTATAAQEGTANTLDLQEQLLMEHCKLHNYEVVASYKFVHSGLSCLTSSAFTQILNALKGNPGYADILLFTDWSRFSRRPHQAFQMTAMLQEIGITPQAVKESVMPLYTWELPKEETEDHQ